MIAAARASSHTLSKRVVLCKDQIDDRLRQEPFLKSNYTTVCHGPSSLFPSFSLVHRLCVFVCCVHSYFTAHTKTFFIYVSVWNECISVCVHSQALHSGQNEWASSRGVCVCVCKIICRTKRRGGFASPCLRHRGTPLGRMSLLVLLSHKTQPCQTLNQSWIDSCLVSSHIRAPALLPA